MFQNISTKLKIKYSKVKMKKENQEEIIVEEEVLEITPELEEAEETQVTEKMKKVKKTVDMSSWTPKTKIGNKIKAGEITDIDILLDNGIPILESEIIDFLVPNIEVDLLLIGQSRGKFGGGQRRVFKQTQKKTREGNKPQFATIAVVGNMDGYVGIGYGKAKETVPAREKAIRNAKLSLIKIRRGCGDWACECGNPHTIPLKVEAKTSSVSITLMPAPKGKGLCIEKECQKILKLAGIKDIWSKTRGRTKTKSNLIKACFLALKELSNQKISSENAKKVQIISGRAIKSAINEA
jgi:small subunit ribosomal protein S5